MYEMHVGTAISGTRRVWHVVAHDHRATLCGQPVDAAADDTQTDHHCLPCMTAFQRLMQSVEPA